MASVFCPGGAVRIVYGNHAQPVDPRQVRPASPGAAAVVLETGEDDWATNPEASLSRYRDSDPQYADLFPMLEREHVPVYFLEAPPASPWPTLL